MESCKNTPESSLSSLPEDITINILARLPLIHLQRARTVCTAWNRLAADPAFARFSASQSCTSISLPGFALFVSNESTSELFYLDLNDACKWRSIPLAFLPNFGASLKLLASSGGLLLLGTLSGDLLVANAVTRHWQELPPTETICDSFYTALMVDSSAGNFTVVVAESELRSCAATEIFESKTGRWRAGIKPSRAGRWKRVASSLSTPWYYGSVPVFCKPVYCCGAFYHLTWDPEKMVSELDVRTGVWRCEKGQGAVPGAVPWGVMENKGKIVMLEMSYSKQPRDAIVASTKLAHSSEATLSLWELQPRQLQWVCTRRIPSPPKSEFHVDKWQQFAFGNGFLCTTFLVLGTVVTFGSQSDPQRGMIYDCVRDTWLTMPDLPGTPWGSISSLVDFKASLHPL
ncbi:hypothetical protein L7F22_064695 [Adiantum nelumboides]|nr:hypothetical protein [Adiantum nelumboides]